MRILLVEDEPKVAGFVQRGLTAERYAVDVSADGQEGWELAEAYPYDLIILDLMLPTLEGKEVLQRIRKKNTSVPVLILTARDTVDDKVRLFEMGADDYLTKPFAFDEFMARIRNLLRRYDGQSLPTITVGGLAFDPHLRNVSINGTSVIFHGRELMMLEVLIRNVGRMVSRQTLIDEIYDFSENVEPRAVNLVAQRLRNRLIQLNAGVEIHAARGVGYMLSKAFS